ncbi:MAG: inorganic pyrophosphatase [Planctomycetes bacterium]|nr:inorganic pyrophosphatase [Planctomycetota bacterium]
MNEIESLLAQLNPSHPWHGVSPLGEGGVYTAYIELVPTDGVKYEIDKPSGLLKVDRPQKYSSLCPTLYGFIPRTYCGDRVGAPSGIRGDGDPLDICVLTEKGFSHGDVLVPAIPIGGLRMIERGEADDKVLAVLRDDATYGGWRDLAEVPQGLLDRLCHYFLTYKEMPGAVPRRVEIPEIYGKAGALDVIARAMEDYRAEFGTPEERAGRLRAWFRG